jgi:hypothetical protein
MGNMQLKLHLVKFLIYLMKTQSLAATSSVLNIKMVGTAELEGVVVTALGIKREKKSLGYATQELKSEELKSELPAETS